jgi:hypothetical protein
VDIGMELTMGSDRRGRRFIAVGKFIAYYTIMIVSLVWIADVFVNWSVPHLLELLVLLIAPAFVSGFLIYESRRKVGAINTWLLIGELNFILSSSRWSLCMRCFILMVFRNVPSMGSFGL